MTRASSASVETAPAMMGSSAAFAEGLLAPTFWLADQLRRWQAHALGQLGIAPKECDYRVLVSSEHWRVREYIGLGDGPPLLIVAAPIKQPYIWDLAPDVSPIRYCLAQHFRVYLLEWLPPRPGRESGGLSDYAGRWIGEAAAAVSRAANGAKPFLLGHSLGGTLAALFAASGTEAIGGLALISAPLSFEPGCSTFRDAIVAMASRCDLSANIIPGSLLSQFSALASPDTFVWSRLIDAGLSLSDLRASAVHALVERWTLDEVPLPGRLFREILEWLYRDNSFCVGTLRINGKSVRPSSLRLPALAVVNIADRLAPPASVAPVAAAMPHAGWQLIEYPGEIGVGMQHVALLVGRQAHRRVWPEIVAWLRARG